MFMPVFGGPVENLTFTVDRKGCEALHKIVKAQMDDARLKYNITECWRSNWDTSVHGGPAVGATAPGAVNSDNEVKEGIQ